MYNLEGKNSTMYPQNQETDQPFKYFRDQFQ